MSKAVTHEGQITIYSVLQMEMNAEYLQQNNNQKNYIKPQNDDIEHGS